MPLREYCYRICINASFTYFITGVLALNVIVLCMPFYGMPSGYAEGLTIAGLRD